MVLFVIKMRVEPYLSMRAGLSRGWQIAFTLFLVSGCVGSRPFLFDPTLNTYAFTSPTTIVPPVQVLSGNSDQMHVPPRVAIEGTTNAAANRASEELPLPAPTTRPRTLRSSSQHQEFLDLSYPEVLRIALENCELIRTDDFFLSSSNPLFTRPEQFNSVYDSAIQASEVLLGQRGVQGALADFDTQFNTRMFWGKNEQVQNSSLLSGGIVPGTALVEDTANFQSELARNLGSGGRVAMIHDWAYSQSNRSNLLFPSAYTGTLRAQLRQPLLAGAGAQYTSIAGPIGDNLFAVTGIPQGLVIASVQQDISVTELEQNLGKMLRELESLYWQLYSAYRTLEVSEELHRDAEKAYGMVVTRHQANTLGSGAAELGAFEELVLLAKIDRDNAFDAVLSAEARLRRLMGLPLGDEALLRPSDKPTEAEFVFDWESGLYQATLRRPEIRRQEMNVRALRLQVQAAENLLKPRLDLVGEYRLNGFGDRLLGEGDPFVSGYDALLNGDHTAWDVGVQCSMILGNRVNQQRVRNLNLKLARALAVLQEQHAELSHELASAFRGLDRTWLELATQRKRVFALEQRTAALEAQYRVRGQTSDLVLLTESRQSLGQAQIASAQSLIRYADAITEVHYRMGQILPVHQVVFANTEHGMRIESLEFADPLLAEAD